MSKLKNWLIVGSGFLAVSVIAISAIIRIANGGAAMAGPAKETMSNRGGFAVVELFTSEGCSSCPPAEANLRRITEEAKANGTKVYALDFHIDYWDHLGWIDVASNAAATVRQRTYAQQFSNQSVYTPQMIVNGIVEFNGSNRKRSDIELATALAQQPAYRLSVSCSLSGASTIGSFNNAFASSGRLLLSNQRASANRISRA